MPTIEDAQPTGGSDPGTWIRVANLGTTAGTFELALVQDGDTLAQDSVRVDAGTSANVTLEALPDPGPAHVELTSPAIDGAINWTMNVPDLRPDVRVLHTRMDPVSPDAGETVEIQATIANEGGSAVDLRPDLFIDGVLHTVTEEGITIAAGAVDSVTFEWTAEDGDHTVAVSADPQDRIQDRDASDDARGTELEIQGGSTTGSLDVPFPALSVVVTLLGALAWLRRGRRA